MKTKGYQELIVWQKSMLLAREVYLITEKLPSSEKFGLSSQMTRAAVSIPSNIAEGSKRNTVPDFKHFLAIALGSLAELETQIHLLKTLSFGKKINYKEVDILTTEVTRMLVGMIKSPKLYQNLSKD